MIPNKASSSDTWEQFPYFIPTATSALLHCAFSETLAVINVLQSETRRMYKTLVEETDNFLGFDIKER